MLHEVVVIDGGGVHGLLMAFPFLSSKGRLYQKQVLFSI
jgi:hypothetical protein